MPNLTLSTGNSRTPVRSLPGPFLSGFSGFVRRSDSWRLLALRLLAALGLDEIPRREFLRAAIDGNSSKSEPTAYQISERTAKREKNDRKTKFYDSSSSNRPPRAKQNRENARQDRENFEKQTRPTERVKTPLKRKAKSGQSSSRPDNLKNLTGYFGQSQSTSVTPKRSNLKIGQGGF